MINQFNKSNRIVVLLVLIVSPILILYGCASHKAAEVQAEGKKLITDITTSEDAQSTVVSVKSNGVLTYTSIKQVFPLGVLFYFPETSLDNIKTVHEPPDNDIISSIKATEVTEDDQTTTSRMFISLKRDVPYDINPDEAGLHISFPKKGIVATQMKPMVTETEATEKPEPPTAKKAASKATRIQSVTATALQKNVVINVKADGTIANYKSFTIDNPPRIVIDMYSLKSPFKKEQRIAVKSKWVKRIRHFGHPDKVRMVLETEKAYLSKYTATPTDGGLLVHVGQTPAPVAAQTPQAAAPEKKVAAVPAKEKAAAPAAEKKPPEKEAVAEKKEAEPEKEVKEQKFDKPAWVNRIDFSSEEEGKSAVIIGTTRPVTYEIKKVADRRVHLKLFDTNLPAYRKRALITTRFESAVDRITPLQTAAMKNETLFTIELREAVAFYVDQKDDILRVNFSASKIPPKPYEDAQLPAWKKVLAEAEAEPGIKVETPSKADTVAAAEKKRPSAQIEPDTGEVKFQGRPEDLYDINRQRREMPYGTEEKELDIYGEIIAKRYTGEKIALDFYDTDIKNVFRILKEVSGRNFAVDKNVTGKVTLSLDKPVPWDQVLDLVLKMNQLGRTMEGDIIRIATLVTLANEEKLRKKKLQDAQASARQEDFLTAFLRVNYADATSVASQHITPLLTPKRTVSGDAGSVTVDARLNMIILTDVPTVIKRAKEIIQRIDLVTPQVIIEARIVEANTNFSRDLGFDWGTVTLGQFDIGGLDVGPTTFQASNLPDGDPSAVLGFNFFKLGGTSFTIVDAKLEAAEVEGKTNILSSPKIVTLDNKKAKIKQGFEVPYLERDSSGNATVRFKDVDLLLEVTPQVTPDDRISMTIFVTKNDLVDPTQPEPALSTNEAETEVLLDDGDTVVIGGIMKSSRTWAEDRIPGLGKLPVLGWLFKSQSRTDDKNELLIFLTPQIVKLKQKPL